jgi:hypothetical protein
VADAWKSIVNGISSKTGASGETSGVDPESTATAEASMWPIGHCSVPETEAESLPPWWW